MCTVVVSFAPGAAMPVLLLGVRDEATDRPWVPPGRHWPGSPLVGGLDLRAGGTWLAVDPRAPRLACVLNGPARPPRPDGQPAVQAPRSDSQPAVPPPRSDGQPAVPPLRSDGQPAGRRSRGELPLQAASGRPGQDVVPLREPAARSSYDAFHLLWASPAAVHVASWDGVALTESQLDPGTHLLTNHGHEYPPGMAASGPRAAYFGPLFAADRPSGDPGLPFRPAWLPWISLAAGAGLAVTDPRALIVRHQVAGGATWASSSVSLVAIGAGRVRYDFCARPGDPAAWATVLTR